jgi:very-short-patch-repair endonuclease
MSVNNTFREKQKTLAGRRKKLLLTRTKCELQVEQRLKEAGIRFIAQKGFILGNNYCIADFYLPRPYKAVIEIDGGYHGTEKQKIRDRSKDTYYQSRGFQVIRIKNEEVEFFDPKTLIPKIKNINS